MPNSKPAVQSTSAITSTITSTRIFLALLIPSLLFAACSSTPPPPEAAVVLRNQAADQIALARSELNRSAYQNATAYARSALYLSESVDDSRGISSALLVLGSAELRQAHTEAAAGLLARALQVAGLNGTPALVAEVQIALGNLALQVGSNEEAGRHSAEARASLNQDADSNADLLLLEARIADRLDQGDPRAAYAKAVQGFRQQKIHESTANALYFQASYLSRSGDPAAAKSALEEALQLDRQMEHQNGILADLRALALLASRQGELDQAYQLLIRAFAVSSGMAGVPHKEELLEELAENRQAAGDTAAAQSFRAWDGAVSINEFLGKEGL